MRVLFEDVVSYVARGWIESEIDGWLVAQVQRSRQGLREEATMKHSPIITKGGRS